MGGRDSGQKTPASAQGWKCIKIVGKWGRKCIKIVEKLVRKCKEIVGKWVRKCVKIVGKFGLEYINKGKL